MSYRINSTRCAVQTFHKGVTAKILRPYNKFRHNNLKLIGFKFLIAIIISVIAAALSFWSLWLSRLQPFKLMVAAGEIRLRIYPVKNGKKKWYILTLAAPMYISNVGAQAGQVTTFRIKANFSEIENPEEYVIFDLYGEVDRKLYEENVQHIFTWQDVATVRGDEPFVILPHSTVSKYLIFSTHTKYPIGSEKVTYTLEVSERGMWRDLETWNMAMLPIYWSELVENRTSIGTFPITYPLDESTRENDSLLKKLEIKQELPKGGFQAAPTYLDYPSQDESDHITG